MKIRLIRHGDPNYEKNCLTPLGHDQAEALAERLYRNGVRADAVCSSKYGRAVETAEHTAKKYGLPVQILDFAHEIESEPSCLSPEEQQKYGSWPASFEYVKDGINLSVEDPRQFVLYGKTGVGDSDRRVREGFDAWLAAGGYEKEGLYYRCTRKNDSEVLFFTHGGVISFLVAYLLHINPLAVCCYTRVRCTGITEIEFAGNPGDAVCPVLYCFDDASHLELLGPMAADTAVGASEATAASSADGIR